MMDIFTIFGIILVVIAVLYLGKVLSFLLRFVFYILLGVLVLVFVFGISYVDVLNVLESVVLLAF